MKNYLPVLFVAMLICTGLSPEGEQPEKCIVKSEFIYNSDAVAFPSCHASTIAEIPGGVISAWFGGTAERNPDVGIWVSRFINGSWSAPVEVANGIADESKRYPTWNPVLYNTGKKILLFYKTGPSPSTWWGELKTSTDNGLSWSGAIKLPENVYGPIKNKPVSIEEGVLICPSSTENDGWRVHMEFTDMDGASWTRTQALNGKEIRAIQPTILIHPGGRLQMLCRSGSSVIMTAWSDDKGKTWSDMRSAGLPNPNSGIDAVTLKNGKHFLVYNHLVKGRHMLSTAISSDGTVWRQAVLLENDKGTGEYSYPAVIQTSDGLIHVTYTYNRKLIKHVVIDPSKIEEGWVLDETVD